MTISAIIFYLLAALILAATVLAITRRQVMHAIIYLVISFFAMAPLFSLLGAPFLALLEIIIYAGAIMILFIFIVMMLRVEARPLAPGEWFKQWYPAVGLGLIAGVIMIFLIWQAPAVSPVLPLAMASPQALGRFVFEHYWFAVEIASLLLLVALVGAYYLGRQNGSGEPS